MTLSINFIAGLQSDAYVPTVTTKTAILTGKSSSGLTLVSLRAVSTSGTPSLTLHFFDNSKGGSGTELLIYPATSLSTSTATEIDLSGITLGASDELRATVSATDVNILLTYAVRGGGSGI